MRARHYFAVSLTAALASCNGASDATESDSTAQAATPSNQLELSPTIINNLGITFETATRGTLGTWLDVPGQLEVPQHRRWMLRTPARARVLSVLPQWQSVSKGDELAALESPALQHAQHEVESAQRMLIQVQREVELARARLRDGEIVLREAQSFESTSRQRLDGLQALADEGNPLTAEELVEARRAVADATRASLEAALARDELTLRVQAKELETEVARRSTEERLNGLALLTGMTKGALTATSEQGQPVWQTLELLYLRAPTDGTIVELLASQGEVLAEGTSLIQLFDTSELWFRGRLPEGDRGSLAAGQRVRLEFPVRGLAPVETQLSALVPVTDERTRMLRVQAPVANPEGTLAHGMSVMASVLISESPHEEVLIPERCVVFDGLEAIVFRRDPGDPDVVIRTPVELGSRATGRVEIFAGILDGDQIVADGIHQLEQSGLGKPPPGGHFHADGTFHEDHD